MKLVSMVLFLFVCLIHLTLDTAFAQDTTAGKDNETALFYKTVSGKLSAGSFEEVEQVLSALLASQKMTINGKRQLEALFNEFEAFQDIKLLDSWCDASVKSHFPFTIRGSYYLRRAWQMYGYLYYTPNKTDLKDLFATTLEKAQSDLEKAFSMNKQDPAIPTAMITICLLRGYPNNEMEKWFLLAKSADPFWFASYENKLRYLSPYHFGSRTKMLNFAIECYEGAPSGSSVYAVLLRYFEMMLPIHRSAYPQMMYALNLYAQAHKVLLDCIDRFRNDFSESSIPSYYEGLYRFYQSEYDVALALFSNILKKEPDNIKVLQQRVNLHMAMDDWQLAEKDLLQILSLEPDSPFTLTNLGAVTILAKNDLNKGQEFYTKGISLQKSPFLVSQYYYDIGSLLESREQYRAAAESFGEAVKSIPHFEKAVLKRGQCKFSAGDVDGAIADMILLADMNGKFTEAAQRHIEEYRSQKTTMLNPPQQQPKPSSETALPQPRPEIHTADIVSSFPGSSQNETTVSSGQQMTQCEGFYYRKMRDEAIACFSDLLLKVAQSEQGQIYFMLGKVSEKMDFDWPKASTYYERAVIKNQNHEGYIFKLGQSLYMQREFDMAISVFSKLVELNPRNGNAYYFRGLCFDNKGEIEEAVNDMQLVRIYDPGNIGAARYLEQHAMKQPPVNMKIAKVDELLMLAEDNMRLNRIDKAERQFKEILSINPTDDYATFRLGILYLQRDRDEQKALVQFNKAISLNDQKVDYFYNRASLLERSKNYQAAIDNYTQYLKLRPKEASVHSYRAACYEKLGDYQKAENDYKLALKYAPGHSRYMSKLAGIATKTGATIELTKDNVGLLIERGKKYVTEKEFENAKKDFFKASELDPQNAEAFYLIARLYQEKLKDQVKAITYYSQAIERDKGKRSYYFKRGLIYFNQKEYEPAKQDFDAALALSLNDGQILYYRGYCNQKLGLKDQAVEDYLKAKEFAPSWTDSVNAHLEQMM